MMTEIQNLLNGESDNLYVYTKIVIDKDRKFKMETNSAIQGNLLSDLGGFIDKLSTKNIILVCRSSNEPFAEEVPTNKQLSLLEHHINKNDDKIKNWFPKNIKIFFQEPWPEPVPSFFYGKGSDVENNTSVIRFGYDEGCELDKKCTDSSFSIEMNVGSYVYLINKNKSINLTKNISLI
tara:strand:+ start:120 stop:656 length:537 start_codon:yes stop_codon:yes gene_type:complete